jgi:signal transduction histidine kinase
MIATNESYAGTLADRLLAQRVELSARWLEQLKELLPVAADAVFPSELLLDHIPLLITEIAAYLRAPEHEEIAANTAVIEKARELGVLRHNQHASVHQLLREYEILSEILEAFVAEETRRLGLTPTSDECFEVLQRLMRAARMLMRATVDTFVGAYTAAIQERNDRISRFNQMASHELRSPISTLLVAGTLLANDAVHNDTRRVAKVGAAIRSNAERLSWLVDNLQRLTRLTDGSDTPSQQFVELGAIAGEVARQLAEMAQARGVTIHVGSDMPSIVVDPARLELILLNLVSNAIKYSDPAKSDRHVAITAAAAAPDAVAISVRDNGLGIPGADRHAVFDRFFRAHTHLDGELGVSGSGLGLAIVAECVQAIGGTVTCQSQVGEGTEFVVSIPIRPA